MSPAPTDPGAAFTALRGATANGAPDARVCLVQALVDRHRTEEAFAMCPLAADAGRSGERIGCAVTA
jgi:hypothetical protein